MINRDAVKNIKNKCCLLLLILIYLQPVRSIEPLSIGIGVAGVAAYGFFKDQTYCRYYECCDERSIPADVQKLKHTLSKVLFGQHIVEQNVIPALSAHFQPNSPSRKPLVISFHGTPGTGKSFVADLIAEALYTQGTKSKYVHKYLGRADFANPQRLNEYKDRINSEVRSSIQSCPRSLFIFEEVDKMPIGVFDTLTSLIDYAASAKGDDYTKAIFIFLSNTAGVHISDHLADLMKRGVSREDTHLFDFEEMLKLSAYNMEGGLKKTHMIEAHVIDHYIPFLALEKAHIAQCVEAEFSRFNIRPNTAEINSVINSAVVYDPKNSMFATFGCKTIEKKVAIVANQPRQ